MQIKSNIESPKNIPEILDLLAPIALEMRTPGKCRVGKIIISEIVIIVSQKIEVQFR